MIHVQTDLHMIHVQTEIPVNTTDHEQETHTPCAVQSGTHAQHALQLVCVDRLWFEFTLSRSR